ncbi:MAG: peroxidase family protein [Verrucomicrobiales bacterium]
MNANSPSSFWTPLAHTELGRRLFLAGISLLIPLSFSQAQQPERPISPNERRKSMLPIPPPPPAQPVPEPGDVRMGMRTIALPEEFRTIDGTGNNLNNPDWGSADSPFLRLTTVDYGDGKETPSGAGRPGARVISNEVCVQEQPRPNLRQATDFVWQWGQFLDHDIDLTPTADPPEPFDIPVPAGDLFFDPQGTGKRTIPLNRSYYDYLDGIRQQKNEITAYIDASNVYGSDLARVNELRANDGSGRLKTSPGDLLPFNVNAFPNAPVAEDASFFLAGDFRANEQVGLTAMHTLFVREHNYWAGVIAKANPGLSDDQIFESARVLVAAEIQSITYREFLPVLLGPRALPRYQGYRPEVNAGIANVFATASYRFGHSMLSETLLRLDRTGREIKEGHLELAKAFFNPKAILDQGGIDPILRGLAAQPAQEIDTWLVDAVRNFLFGPPGAGGFDLASLNIQRGRDHGLASHARVRLDYGLRPVKKFSDITPDRKLQRKLESVYGSVDAIDAWVGGLAEPHARDALVGETILTVLREQFIRLRDGDRFWYQNYLDRNLQQLIEDQTLARIIRRNTTIRGEIADNVFLLPSKVSQPGATLPLRGAPPRR